MMTYDEYKTRLAYLRAQMSEIKVAYYAPMVAEVIATEPGNGRHGAVTKVARKYGASVSGLRTALQEHLRARA